MYTWIKVYTEVLDDPKMARLPADLWRLAVELMLMAGKEGEEGVLPPLADMAWSLRRRDEDLEEDLGKLSQAIGVAYDLKLGRWVLTHFVERQAALTSTERKRKQRGSNAISEMGQEKPVDHSSDLGKTNDEDGDVTDLSRGMHIFVTGEVTKMSRTCHENVTEEEVEVDKSRKEKKKSRSRSRSAAAAAAGVLEPKIVRTADEDVLVPPDEYAGLRDLYEAEVDRITPMVEAWLEDVVGEYGAISVEYAIREGVMSGIKSLKYFEAIMARRRRDGEDAEGSVLETQTLGGGEIGGHEHVMGVTRTGIQRAMGGKTREKWSKPETGVKGRTPLEIFFDGA